MPSERFFYDEPLKTGDKVSLKEKEHHHLTHVMRIGAGEEIELVNGKGQLAVALVDSVDRHAAHLTIQSVHTEEKSARAQLVLAQAIPRFNRLEYILEKGVELGADEFWLFPSKYSEKNDFSPSQIERMHLLCVAAMKQCGRLYLPSIRILPPLEKWPKIEGSLFFGDTRATAVKLKSEVKRPRTVFFVGPEKGWHPDEIETLEKTQGATGVTLHHNILRVDTAPLVALALLSHT